MYLDLSLNSLVLKYPSQVPTNPDLGLSEEGTKDLQQVMLALLMATGGKQQKPLQMHPLHISGLLKLQPLPLFLQTLASVISQGGLTFEHGLNEGLF